MKYMYYWKLTIKPDRYTSFSSDAANNLTSPTIVQYSEFYNPTLDHLDLMAEYYTWQNPSSCAGYSVTDISFIQGQDIKSKWKETTCSSNLKYDFLLWCLIGQIRDIKANFLVNKKQHQTNIILLCESKKRKSRLY